MLVITAQRLNGMATVHKSTCSKITDAVARHKGTTNELQPCGCGKSCSTQVYFCETHFSYQALSNFFGGVSWGVRFCSYCSK